MTSTRQLRSRLGGLGLASVVMAVLVGLLGMHGLSPSGGLDGTGSGHHGTADAALPHTAPAPPAEPPAEATRHVGTQRITQAATAGLTHGVTADPHAPGPGERAGASTRADQACSHGTGGGHPRHADGTCAAGAVSAAPALSAPATGTDTATDVAPAFGRVAPAASASRAPPSLAELQLLRI
ncbi:hypothetical protein GL263_08650 [Streptomyces durbertensis]|uniref:Uncharacterized protein n=1 Tax=Streptomyces durbertensis TaxID=2448886 RepID=A0ABR6EEP1_9ACTN|nr:DUF6153 family protein [Streptomyces durbertensis]MBB1243628.1 hypothetical protein [Streptomyces durbertensis]